MFVMYACMFVSRPKKDVMTAKYLIIEYAIIINPSFCAYSERKGGVLSREVLINTSVLHIIPTDVHT